MSEEKMDCLFCKGTGKIKKKQMLPDLCPQCAGQVFVYEFQINDDQKSFQLVCINCGTLAGGTTDSNHDLTQPSVCSMYRGNWKDYIKFMKERFNLEVSR